MPKRFKSWKRAIRRGHLDIHIFRDHNNIVHSMLCHTTKRFGDPNPKNVYMSLGSVKGDPENEGKK